MIGLCDKCCTTTSPGRPRQRCPATPSPPIKCRTASTSHTGHGTDSRFHAEARLKRTLECCERTFVFSTAVPYRAYECYLVACAGRVDTALSVCGFDGVA